ncbi:MAG: phosphatidylglycerophosphatase A [Polyangia bacterium]
MTEPTRPPLWATIIATSFGAGFSPLAPGTMGTLTAIPMAWAVAKAGPWAFLAATLVITVIGTLAADTFQKAHGTDDDQRIVVDEVAGYFVTLLLVPHTGVHLALAFVLFRLFDIWKPWPVRFIDRTVDGGWGVMADDLAAGGYAALCLLALDYFGVVARLTALVS